MVPHTVLAAPLPSDIDWKCGAAWPIAIEPRRMLKKAMRISPGLALPSPHSFAPYLQAVLKLSTAH